MALIKRFEEIKAWQAARVLMQEVYRVTNEGAFSKDFALRDQIRRAAGSCMHNIAEGFEAGTRPEFVRFLRYSLRSTVEVQSQLYAALDQSYIPQAEFDTLYTHAEGLKHQLNGFIAYLSKQKTPRQLREFPAVYITGNEEDDHR